MPRMKAVIKNTSSLVMNCKKLYGRGIITRRDSIKKSRKEQGDYIHASAAVAKHRESVRQRISPAIINH